MTVTYISHCGFLVEWEHFYTLFDWWKGELPPLRADKPLLVFASHSHEDHFDKRIFTLPERHADTRFILSHDIRLATRRWEKLGMTREIFSRVTSLRSNTVYTADGLGTPLTVRTIHSTDLGVAFLLSAEGRLVYHAGDLNWWHWVEEGERYCQNMEASYARAVARLADAVRDEAADCGRAPCIDVAFAPIDPRLGDDSDRGVAYLLEQIPVQTVFPMHMWDRYDWIDRYLRAHPDHAGQIARITREGERFNV